MFIHHLNSNEKQNLILYFSKRWKKENHLENFNHALTPSRSFTFYYQRQECFSFAVSLIILLIAIRLLAITLLRLSFRWTFSHLWCLTFQLWQNNNCCGKNSAPRHVCALSSVKLQKWRCLSLLHCSLLLWLRPS